MGFVLYSLRTCWGFQRHVSGLLAPVQGISTIWRGRVIGLVRDRAATPEERWLLSAGEASRGGEGWPMPGPC